jgi:hypothetical protein
MSNTFDNPDLPATAEELAQAEALAKALDGTRADLGPELETASLLRQAHGTHIPDVLDQVLPTLRARPRRRWWLLPVLLVPATVGLLVVGATMVSHRPVPQSIGQNCIPAQAGLPSAELLAAQANAARGDRAALAALEAEMRRSRPRIYRVRERQ